MKLLICVFDVCVQPVQCTQMNQKALNDLLQGLQLLEIFDLPKEHMISVKHLQCIAAEGPNGRVRTIFEVQ